MNIEKIVLEGQRVRLEPLASAHLEGLAEAIRDGELWEIPFTFVPRPDELAQFLDNAETAHASQQELAFATIDAATSKVVGSTRFRRIDAQHRRVEVGFTFIAASWQRSHINTEAKYLMLKHAFEVWGCHRVELLTDELNTKSRTAICRIGAREEGILRSHMVMRDGRIRNSAIYSITSLEWPAVKEALRAKLDQ